MCIMINSKERIMIFEGNVNNSNYKLINGDSLEILKTLPDKSVDAVITDPPYMGVVSDEWDNQWKTIDEFIEWCDIWIGECRRVLKDSGTFFIFGYPYQLGKLINVFEKHGFTFRQSIVVHKGLRSVAGRVSNKLKIWPVATEYIHYYYVDSRNKIRDILNQKKIEFGMSSKEINEYLGKATNGGGTWSSIAGIKQKDIHEPTRLDWEKLDILFRGLPPYDDIVYKFNGSSGLTDVWDDIDFYDRDYRKIKFHPTQKPLTLIERLVKSCTDEGDVILDPFLGSGSTGISCLKNKRNFIGIELSEDYITKSNEWVSSLIINDKFF